MQQLPPTDPRAIIVRDYRRKLSLTMKAIGPEGIRKITAGPCLVQRKMDGVFSVLFYQHGVAVLVDAAGRCRDSGDVPELHGIEGALRDMVTIASLTAAGELFAFDPCRERVRGVAGCQPDRLRWHSFDLLELNGGTLGPRSNGKGSSLLDLVQGVREEFTESAELSTLFAQWVTKDGAEGLVVRQGANIWKIKPVHTVDACILAFAEGSCGEVRDVLLGVWRDAVTVQRLCSCGTGFDRKALFQQLLPLVTASDYTETNAEHAPYRMVANAVAVELAFTDLCADNAQGEPVKRPVLEFSGGRWHQVCRKPGVSVLFPRILRVRDDKAGIDCRMSQITDLVQVEGADDAIQTEEKPRETLARAVFVKTIKGAVAVRKLVLLRMPEKPEYVIHYTDFSAGRKTPLERDLWASNDEQQAQSRFCKWGQEIAGTRGWEVAK